MVMKMAWWAVNKIAKLEKKVGDDYDNCVVW
jgi:hypothetical protein